MARTAHGSTHVGHTDDLADRFAELGVSEDRGKSGRPPRELVYWEGYATRDEARRRAEYLASPAGLEWIEQEAEAGRLKAPPRPGCRLVPLKEDGTLDLKKLNAEFDREYLQDKRNPRWVPKPTVAYLWARTVECKNCRATIPLLKTRWLCKKRNKRVLLTMRVVDAASPPRGHVEAASGRLQPSDETSLLHYFDPSQPIADLSGNLPHWRQPGATYSVTFRLGDSLPQEKLQQWMAEREAWLKAHPEPHDRKTKEEYFRLFPARFQAWLDAGYGECLLARPEIKQLVEAALRHFNGTRYVLDEHVVMPNHVHAIVTPLGDHELSAVLHSWKSFTAHEINKTLGRSGTVWQKESFDHIVRGPNQLERIRQYIRENPRGGGSPAPLAPARPHAVVEASSRRLKEDTRRDVASTIVFGVEANVPVRGGNAAQRREHDKRIGAGTMSRSGATCPCCEAIMTMQDIRLEGQAGRLGATMTAVVVDGTRGKEYRLPTAEEIEAAAEAERELDRVFADVPFGIPEEPTPAGGGSGACRAFSVQSYGMRQWRDLFTPRQLLALGAFLKWTRAAKGELPKHGYGPDWTEGIVAYLATMFDRLSNQSSNLSRWNQGGEKIEGTLARFALPILWDYAECNPLGETSGGYPSAFGWVTRVAEHLLDATATSTAPSVLRRSAIRVPSDSIDCIVTDPPYYDAIPYSDLMDYFHVWLRRNLHGLGRDIDEAFQERLSPKWSAEEDDGELIDDESRHGGDTTKSRAAYENGMARVFQACSNALKPDGRLVIVFAHKEPNAWETLVSAIIRAGFVVDGSWPIQTEREARARAHASAALASSVWLVCKKRPGAARPGWDNRVLEEMRGNISRRLREYWDAGIRGPDFVWAATGPALEAYSKHPIVKKANEPGQLMSVTEFLQHVRRMVVDFVVGRVLSADSGSGVPPLEDTRRDVASTIDLDDVTTYYLLHRHDFGMGDAPIGPCILYAVSCGLSDSALADQCDILVRTGGRSSQGNEDHTAAADAAGEIEEGTGSTVKLKTWKQRKRANMGYDRALDSPRARRDAATPTLFPDLDETEVKPREIPLIDQVHRLMHLWRAGDVVKVDEYLGLRALRRSALFHQLLQALIELAPAASEERSILESLSNHVAARGVAKKDRQRRLEGFSAADAGQE